MSHRPIIDAGPGLNFLSINKERLLIQVLGQLSPRQRHVRTTRIQPRWSTKSHGNGRDSRSCDDDELSGRVIRFHGSVRLGNLIEAIHVIDGYDGIAGGDSVEKLLQYSRG